MNAPNPFDMIRQSVLAIQTQNELAAARIEIARLKAEVERLTAFTTRTIIPNEELQAQVERLTKAGDAMAFELEPILKYNPSSEDIRYQVRCWHAAKEGKDKP